MSASFSKNNSTIINGQVLSSTVDMGNKKITTVATPTASQDAVNKGYCDQNSANGIPTITVTLTGTNWNIILIDQLGTFDFIISNIVVGGPCGKFTLMKPDASRNASVQRWGSNAGSITFERLEMRWLPNTGIELRKNKVNYNGQYRVRYFKV